MACCRVNFTFTFYWTVTHNVLTVFFAVRIPSVVLLLCDYMDGKKILKLVINVSYV